MKATRPKQPKQEVIKELDFKYNDIMSLHTKIAIMSFHNIKYSKYIEIFLVFIEYFQLISQIIFLISESSMKDIFQSDKALLKGILFACKLANPFYCLDRNNQEKNLFTPIFYMLIGYTFLKHALFIYVVRKRASQTPDLLIIIWRWLLKFQGRVLYFISSSFWFETIRKLSKDSIETYRNETKVIVMFISILMIILEYFNSLYPLIRYQYVLPTKNFLSEKENYIQIITLTQKLLLQIFQACLQDYNTINAWVFSSISLLNDLFRIICHFRRLPFFKIEALFYQGSLLMIPMSLDITWISQIMLNLYLNYNIPLFLWISWSILSILTAKLSKVYLKRFICNLVTNPFDASPQLMIHRVYLVKQIRKMARQPNHNDSNYDFFYLIKQTISNEMKIVFQTNSESSENIVSDISLNKSFNAFLLHYLESLQIKFPKSSLIKLHLVHFSAKKFRSYAKVFKIIKQIELSGWDSIKLCSSLLILDIQNILASRYEDQYCKINLLVYIESQSLFNQLKQKISIQTESQGQIYQEILMESPRFAQIIDLSQQVHSIRNEIEQKIVQMFETIPEYFIEPLAFLTQYYFIVNHSPSEALKYSKLYSKKHEKYKKYFESEDLHQENVYQSSSIFMLLSGQKHDAGNIIFCTKSVQNIYGIEARFLFGKNVSTLSTPLLQSFYLEKFKMFIENEGHSDLNVIFHDFGCHQEGYMMELEHYMNIYPFLDRGFCLAAIIRQVKTTRDCLLINANGDIESFTKEIQETLKLQVHDKFAALNLKLISQELSNVIKAFNKLASENKTIGHNDHLIHPTLIIKDLEQNYIKYRRGGISKENEEDIDEIDLTKAQNLYSIYTTEGKELLLKSLINDNTYLYHCKIKNIYPERKIRLIILERVERDDQKNLNNLNLTKNWTLSKTFGDEESQDSDFLRIEEKRLESKESPKKIPESLCKVDSPSKIKELQTTHYILPEKLINETRKIQFSTLLSEKNCTEPSNLISPSNSIKLKTFANSKSFLKSQSQIDENKTLPQPINDKQKHKDNSYNKQKDEQSLDASRFSKNSKEIRLSKAYKSALETKSYLKGSKKSCLFFYFVLVALLGIQIYIIATWEQKLVALKAKKDILNNAQLRNYYLIDLPIYLTTILGIEKGKLDVSPIGMDPPAYVDNIHLESGLLRETNAILFGNANSLKEEMRENLFYKDVRIFELCSGCLNPSYIKVDSFQGTNGILEYISRLVPLVQDNITKVIEEIDLFNENCLNDLTLKNLQIAEIFLKSLETQREEILNSNNICLAISCAFLALNAILMGKNIWNHYVTERQNLSALLKLNPIGVNHLMTKLKKFKDSVDNQNTFEPHILENFDPLTFFTKDETSGKKVKKDFIKIPNKNGFIKKYCFLATNLAILVIVMSGLIFWSAKEVQEFITNINDKQSQLYLINMVRSRATLIGHTITDVVVIGTGRNIENIPILTFIPKSINEIIDLKSKITKIFPADTLDQSSEIQQVLYGDGCQIIDIRYEPLCAIAKTNGILPSFLQALTSFENYLVDFYENFSSLSEDEKPFFKPNVEAYNVYLSAYILMSEAECFFLINKIDKTYDTMLEESISQRNIIFILFTIALGILMPYFWLFSLKDLKEVNNRFKKALGVFPPYLVLSNFLLKSFLMRTSKDISEFTKNGI